MTPGPDIEVLLAYSETVIRMGAVDNDIQVSSLWGSRWVYLFAYSEKYVKSSLVKMGRKRVLHSPPQAQNHAFAILDEDRSCSLPKSFLFLFSIFRAQKSMIQNKYFPFAPKDDSAFLSSTDEMSQSNVQCFLFHETRLTNESVCHKLSPVTRVPMCERGSARFTRSR